MDKWYEIKSKKNYNSDFIILMVGQMISSLYVLIWMVGIFLDYRQL